MNNTILKLFNTWTGQLDWGKLVSFRCSRWSASSVCLNVFQFGFLDQQHWISFHSHRQMLFTRFDQQYKYLKLFIDLRYISWYPGGKFGVLYILVVMYSCGHIALALERNSSSHRVTADNEKTSSKDIKQN